MSIPATISGKLYILGCHYFQREIAAAVAAEGWDDVAVAAFPARCGHPAASWEALRSLLGEDCTQVVILGRVCLDELGEQPANWPPVRLLRQAQCFHLVAGATLVDDAIERGAYLLTPAWLENWPERLTEMGFTKDNAQAFFHDFARELVLLDTGIEPQAPVRLAEFAAVVNLSATRVAVGLDHLRLLLFRAVMEWRLEQAQRTARMRNNQYAQELADHLTAMDCLSRLAQVMTEAEAIASIEELFRMLFAPQELYYLKIENGLPNPVHTIPSALLKQMQELDSEYAWTDDELGFLLRITHGEQILGLIAIEKLALPQFREHYLNLALSIAGVCGLSIENARTYQRIKTADEALRLQSEITTNAAEGIALIKTSDNTIHYANKRFEMLFGYAPGELTGKNISIINSPTDKTPEDTAAEIIGTLKKYDVWSGEVLNQKKDGSTLWTYANVSTFEHPELGTLLITYQVDITEKKKSQALVWHQANFDQLTDLPNRSLFIDRLSKSLLQAKRSAKHVALLFLDLDGFKLVNDSYGHEAGDAVLKTVANRWLACMREVDTIARLGGDEFVAMVGGLDSPDEAVAVAEKLIQSLTQKIKLPGAQECLIGVSVGVAVYPDNACELDSLLVAADAAMYLSKSQGKNTYNLSSAVPITPNQAQAGE